MKQLSTFHNKINEFWVGLTGPPSSFAMEYRIYHSITFITIVSLFYNIPFNLLVGLYMSSLISLLSCVVFVWLYYRSRFMGKTDSSIIIGSTLANVMFVGNFFYNSGISGPTDLLFGLSFLLIIAMTPYSQHKAWLWLNIVIVLALHLTEYYFPQVVPESYHSRIDRFFDKTSAYLVSIILIYYTVKYIRRNYDYEKQQADDRANSIAEQNEFITVQNQQLEQINSEKNKLMSIIAHDLRAPLSNIQNYLELVTEYGLDREEREVVEADLLEVTGNTLNMLSKLLIWSKSQMEGVVVKLSDLNLLDTLRSTLEMERMLALKKRIKLTYLIDPEIIVIADSDMLQLVVRNLVSNAIKFTDPGGTVDIYAEMLMNNCKISVSDNGKGIPYDKQEDIFTLKAKPSFGTNKEKGVGLGLLLCREFTEQQGGRIGFESIPGRGSTFFIYMPVN